MEVSGQLHALPNLPSGKEPPISIRQEAGWAQSRPGPNGEEKRIPSLPLP
jgi:hypothetical protein